MSVGEKNTWNLGNLHEQVNIESTPLAEIDFKILEFHLIAENLIPGVQLVLNCYEVQQSNTPLHGRRHSTGRIPDMPLVVQVWFLRGSHYLRNEYQSGIQKDIVWTHWNTGSSGWNRRIKFPFWFSMSYCLYKSPVWWKWDVHLKARTMWNMIKHWSLFHNIGCEETYSRWSCDWFSRSQRSNLARHPFPQNSKTITATNLKPDM